MTKKPPPNIDNLSYPNSVILNEEDLALFNGVNAYKLALEKQCATMLAATQAQCKLLLKNAKDECQELKTTQINEMQKELQDLSQQLQQENYELLENFLSNVEENIFTLCYKIMAKLHISTIDTQQLTHLIADELLQYSQTTQISISATSTNIDLLKNDLKRYSKKITYLARDNLEPWQCIVSDGLATIYVDIKKCSDYIMEYLSQLANHESHG